MRTITLSNSKGGSAKTTTTVSLASAFAESGMRVLVIDLDPQGSATYWLGGRESATGLVEFSDGGMRVAQLVQTSSARNVDLIPASSSLVPSGEKNLNDTGLALVRGFARLPDYWDLILVDTPPTVGYLSLAPLVACDHVVIPVEAHALAMQGVSSVMTAVQRAREQVNRRLEVVGIVVCRVNATVHARDVVAQLADGVRAGRPGPDGARDDPARRGPGAPDADQPLCALEHGGAGLPCCRPGAARSHGRHTTSLV